MEYLFLNPVTRKWVRTEPACWSREAAAREAYKAHPNYLHAHTAPVLTEREGVFIADHNSVVMFTIVNGRLAADNRMMSLARVK